MSGQSGHPGQQRGRHGLGTEVRLEPEYIAISADSTTAYVTLQENNAIATVDIATAAVTSVAPLGARDHNLAGQGLDPSDRDSAGNADRHRHRQRGRCPGVPALPFP